MPLLIFLLLTFVCSVFLILFLAALFIPLFIIVLLITIFLFASCALEIGSEDELTFQSCELCLHPDDLHFFERLGAQFTTLHKEVVLVGGKDDELFVGEGSHSIGILIHFILDVQSKKSTRDHGVGSEC